MPNHKSAEKRQRQNAKRQARNTHYKSKVRNRIRVVRDALEEGDVAKAAAELPQTVRQIDKVASKGIIPKRRASRIVARLSRAIYKAQNGDNAEA